MRNPKQQRKATIRYFYGVDMEDVDAIFEMQGCACAICKTPLEFHSLECCIDHCHKTGLVRGILCRRCNFGLGNFKDNTEILSNAIKYLDTYVGLKGIKSDKQKSAG